MEGQHYSLCLSDEENTSPKFVQLLTKYNKIFAEPVVLPPQRGPFDHKIHLDLG